MIPIKVQVQVQNFGRDPTLEDQIRIYKTPKSFGARGAADRSVESLRFQVSIVRR